MSVPPLRFDDWSVDHVEAAARLLAERHRRHRSTDPVLPELSEARAGEPLRAQAARPGWVARRDGKVIGYLVYTPVTDGGFTGHAWVDLDGHAASDPETSRSLYAHAARHWVDSGLRQHVVHVPAVEELLWPWFVSSFGVQHTWALRTSRPLAAAGDPALKIRRIGPDEAATAGQAELDLDDHLQASPVFSRRTPTSYDTAVDGQREFLNQDGVYAVVAERDGDHLGYGEVTADPRQDLRAPAGSATIGIVVVKAGGRGLGVGRAITADLLRWAREAGHDHVICDWRATNLDSSRAFLAFGWRPTFYRLHRAIP